MTAREFETYFRKLYMPLGMYALRIVGDADDAEDIVENAFLKVWQSVSSGASVEHFDSFIYRCVRNECVSFLRGKKDMEHMDSIPDLSLIHISEPTRH